MAIIHRTHRPRRPARSRRHTRPVVEQVESRLALSSALPVPSPGQSTLKHPAPVPPVIRPDARLPEGGVRGSWADGPVET
jgi:hypothetical protein